MKWYELALIAGAGFLLLKGIGATGSSDNNGWGSGGSFSPLASNPTTNITSTPIPGTTIKMSTGFLDKVISTGYTTSNIVAAAKAPISGGITVTKAATTPLSADVAAAFKGYTGAIPSSVLSGVMTKSDIQLAKNILANRSKK